MRRNSFPPYAALVCAIWICLALMLVCFGQDASPPPQPSPRGEGVAATQPSPIQALVAFAVPLLIAAFKSRIPERFRKFIPIIAPILGEVLSQLVTSLPAGSGALGGLAGVGLREIKDQHLPKKNDGDVGGSSNGITTALGMAFVVILLLGCAQLKPGADPVVVRAEQTAQLANSTFELFLRLENDRRAFYRTNAPELHAAAEWLRSRMAVTLPDGSQTNVARCDAMIINLLNVTGAYQAGLADRKNVVSAINLVSAAVKESSTWLGVITNGGWGSTPHPGPLPDRPSPGRRGEGGGARGATRPTIEDTTE